MNPPSWLLARPPGPDRRAVSGFEQAWAQHRPAPAARLDPPAARPTWQFLCWLAETDDVVLHGSSTPGLALLEPHGSNDVTEFGAQSAVFATTDGLWAMFFALVNRKDVTALLNASFEVVDDGERPGSTYCYLSVDEDAALRTPFTPGFVYVLPRKGFLREPAETWRGMRVHSTQWASHEPVPTLACVPVAPQDFPLLGGVRTHDPRTVAARAGVEPAGFPWLDDPAPATS